MKLRSLSKVLVYLCLFVVVAVAWWGFDQRSSPGPLHASHASVAALQGNAGCVACHEGSDFTAGVSMAAACNKCHLPIAEQMDKRRGIHGVLKPETANDCTHCHHEHIGDTLGLVTVAAFQRAGVGAPELFDHAQVGGLKLTGKHEELQCIGCHVNAKNTALAEGHKRFLGLTQDCTGCHNDAHKGELGPDCAKCHGQLQAFKDAPLFAHPKTFPLVDGHSKRTCSECHTNPADNFKGLKLDCASCHMDDFDKTTKPAHKLAGLGTDCAKCHSAANWTTTTFVHDARFALEGAHKSTACATCHTAGAPQESVLAHGKNASCVVCHASPHDAKLIEAAEHVRGAAKDACVVCHLPTATTWRAGSEKMTVALHAATGFALVKPHDKQKCSECHAGLGREPVATRRSTVEWKSDFPGRKPDACEECHKDPHAGQFAKSATGGACLACHTRVVWTPTKFDAAMHAKCAFPIDGSHRAVACSACHKIPDGVVGGVRQFVGTKSACVSCHEDIHKGSFDREGLPAKVNGKSDCARCHTTASFKEITWTAAEHLTWTGEALTGKHATASCNDCHRREPPVGRKPVAFKPAPRECAACHEDVHLGQFNPLQPAGAIADCARCHKSNDSFAIVAFDHQKDSRFALDDDHRKLACIACHKRFDIEGREVIRYKPLGVKCADCHDSRPDIPKPGGSSP